MNKILFLTTSYRIGGNGDTLIEKAMEAAQAAGANISRIDIRNKSINPCKACDYCMTTDQCVHKDDFADILAAVKESDSIIISAPIYLNLPSGLAVMLLDRFFATFSPTYQGSGKDKKLGILLTFGNSDPDKMKELVNDAVGFFKQIKELRIDTFPKTSAGKDVCRNTPEYLEKAKEIGEWAATQ